MKTQIHTPQFQALLGQVHGDLLDGRSDLEEDGEIRHPLLTIPLDQLINAEAVKQINSAYLEKKGFAANALIEARYSDYLNLIEPTWRATVFSEKLVSLLTDDQYWMMLRALWLETTYPPSWDGDIWLELFASSRPHRQLLMDAEERAVLAVLPDTLTVYRGGVSAEGLSWTLEKDKARFFAESFAVISPSRGYPQEEHCVFKGTVPKEEVCAYLNKNGDEEIVVNPMFVTVE